MKKKLSVILCIAMILCLIPTGSVFAAKTVKTKSVKVSPQSMTIGVGDVAQINITRSPKKANDKVTWSSSNGSVASVSGGMVQGISPGTATISVTANKKKATCTVVVKDYLAADDAVEKIRNGLKDIFTTKEDVLSLIKENTYTKSEIDTKLSSGSCDNNCDCIKDFTDGQELTLYGGQTLPLSITAPATRILESKELTITSVTVKKFNYNDYYDYSFNPYKYTLEIKGNAPDIPENYTTTLVLTFMSKDKGSSESRFYNLGTEDMGNVYSTYSVEGNEFTLTVDQYNIYSDYEYFFIRSFEYNYDE